MKRFYVQWHLTDNCNLRCRHCYQNSFKPNPQTNFSKLKILWGKIISFCQQQKINLDIALTGGEPFLLPELWPLISFLQEEQQVKRLAIITNGTLLSKFKDELQIYAAGLEVILSLEGASMASNDFIRGRGNYLRVIQACELLLRLKIPFIIMFTLMKVNCQEVLAMIKLGQQIGAKAVILERFFPLGQGTNLKEQIIDGVEFLKIWQKLLDHFSLQACREELIPYRAIRVDFSSQKSTISGAECVVARSGMALMPDGTVFPCRRFPLPAGNLFHQDLATIWQSSLFKRLRQRSSLQGNCRSCSIRNCRGCRAMSYLLSGNPFAADPHCWL